MAIADQSQLYNLNTDPGETIDLFMKEESRLAEMIKLWEKYEAETGLVTAVYEAFGLNGEWEGTLDW